jgi:SAM-dependent methyltransferase
MRRQTVDWDAYLDQFHARLPGITEDVLARCTTGGSTPYEWLLDGVDPSGRIVDLGCGSGPARPPNALRWVGLDRSAEEIRRARDGGRSTLVLGDVTSLPIPDGRVDVVTCSMALMLVRPLGPALEEIHRVLRPAGELRLLLATPTPLTTRDRLRYMRLFWAARSPARFPPSPLRGHAAAETLERSFLRVESDESRRFEYPLVDAPEAARFVDSWYLPGTSEHRRGRARAQALAMVPAAVGIPFRRVVARRMPDTGRP